MPSPIDVQIASIFGARTRRGLIQLTIRDGETVIQAELELTKAREIRGMLDGAIEAAVSDEIFVRFLTERMELPLEAAAVALIELRDMRQGSKGPVYPQ